LNEIDAIGGRRTTTSILAIQIFNGRELDREGIRAGFA
jgi:hypothetical protein